MLNRLKTSKIEIISLVFVLFLAVFILFFKLGEEKVYTWDEKTNIEVVQQNIDSFPSPSYDLEGEDFLEKPPLWYVLTSGLSKLLGDQVWIYRLVSAFSGVATTLLIYKILLTRYSLKAGLVGSLSFLAIVQNIIPNAFHIFFSSHTYRTADLDGLHIFFLFAAFYLFLKVSKRNRYWVGVALALSCAYLTKGPLAFVFMLVFSTLLLRDKYSWRNIAYGWLVFFVPVLVWNLYMYLNFQEEFIVQFYRYHTASRFLQAIESHSQPIHYYIQVFLQPISNPLGIAFFVPILIGLKNAQDKVVKYCLLIISTIVILLSLAQTKLAWYILPIFPFVALMFGTAAEYLSSSEVEWLSYLERLSLKGVVYLAIAVGLILNLSYVIRL